MYLTILGIFLAVISILLALFIAYRQNSDIKQLSEIGKETKNISIATHDTAMTIHTNAYTDEVMKKFFSINQESIPSYKCIFPVTYDDRPLPYIAVGDYNALHVIQSRLGIKYVKLVAIEKTNNSAALLIDTNTIFLCTPFANPALRSIAPPLDMSQIAAPTILNIEIPCWFGEEKKTRVIYISDLQQCLKSPAEEEYSRYNDRDKNVEWKSAVAPVTDYSLILRITIEGKKIIVIAGIHQYGTWIGGEFFRKLITPGYLEPYESIFLSEQDFAAILWGDFDQNEYTVVRCGILQDLIWTRKGDTWTRGEKCYRQAVTEAKYQSADQLQCQAMGS